MKALKKRILWLFPYMFVTAGLWCSCSDDDPGIFATLSGTVTDYETGAPIENATVTLSPSNTTQITDETGSFCFDGLDVAQYTISVRKAGYYTNRKNVTAISGEKMEANITMTKIKHDEEN